MTWFFTADQHFGHSNMLKKEYGGRPFANVDEMDEALIKNHNGVVEPEDTTVHCGDFSLKGRAFVERIIHRLNGSHVFLRGSHDYWLEKPPVSLDIQWTQIWEREFKMDDGLVYITACQFCMVHWPRSRHGSYMVHGHSHHQLPKMPGRLDVGVDGHNFRPVSLAEVVRQIRQIPGSLDREHGKKFRKTYG